MVCPASAPEEGMISTTSRNPRGQIPSRRTVRAAGRARAAGRRGERATSAKPQAAMATLAYQTPRTAAQTEDEYFPDKTIDFHLPLALISAGTLIEVVAALIHGSRSRGGFMPELAELGVHLILGTATMLAGVLVAARFRGIELGKLPTAVMKLAAICIAPGAAVTLLSPAFAVIPFGWVLRADRAVRSVFRITRHTPQAR